LFLQLVVLLLPSRGFKIDVFQDPLLFRGRESRRPLLPMPAMRVFLEVYLLRPVRMVGVD
jgi:hypothetical protein